MNKPVVAFLDHPFHRKTRSSQFFVDILNETFDVHVYYVEDDPRALMQEIVGAKYETVVCWQTEYCAPYFLMHGMRVVCIPMYDGVAHAPDWYWLVMRQARFFSFSERLHRRLMMLGIESYHFRYYNPAMIDVPQATFDELRGFFWQRQPEKGLNWKFAQELIGPAVTSLHIHNAPDRADPADWRPSALFTTSHFTEDGASYREALERANVFLCSRYTEGIGMSMIEAMARGMCIIAHDAPTANEYIIDNSNGLLIDYGAGTKARFRLVTKQNLTSAKADRLGKAARAAFLRGCEEWETSVTQIPFLLHTAPIADLTGRDRSLKSAYLDICRHARNDFGRYLHNLFRLRRKGLTGEEASAIRLRDSLKWYVALVPGLRWVWGLVLRAKGLISRVRRRLG